MSRSDRCPGARRLVELRDGAVRRRHHQSPAARARAYRLQFVHRGPARAPGLAWRYCSTVRASTSPRPARPRPRRHEGRAHPLPGGRAIPAREGQRNPDVRNLPRAGIARARGHVLYAPTRRGPRAIRLPFYGQPALSSFRIVRAPVPSASLQWAAYLAFAAQLALRTRPDVVFTRDLGAAAALVRLPRPARPPLVDQFHGFAPVVSQTVPRSSSLARPHPRRPRLRGSSGASVAYGSTPTATSPSRGRWPPSSPNATAPVIASLIAAMACASPGIGMPKPFARPPYRQRRN